MRHLLRAAPQLSACLSTRVCGASLQNGTRHRREYSRSVPTTSSWLPVPFVTENIAGAHHTTDLFSRLLKERIVTVYGEVDDRMAATVTASLLYLESESDRPISMYINSPGGSVTAGLSIYDCMNYIVPEVSTLVLGQAASMGSLLLAGGAPGKRYCLPHSSIMLHQPSGGHYGTAADIAIHAKEILRIRTQLNKIYERHLAGKKKMSVEEIEKMMERDYFLSAEEALELGVIDEILASRKKAPEKTEDK
ncbi:ATP-dependent Clp endopeptidase, proteolytic subunit ClpP [Rhinocladiella mackenziei CBS 650.93]|uniref:ATP-dependent Clp protease proteolytic subunit n=1 Tax=Rhinocladiella mackenziei CBS 650.93 TaxID=1442369 RepID=A0A0D2J1Y1_9EURO|nr:ATP-dependent Clp endopeptidase, proteolytic subunit ClpP [Rhinocladiella mackenziei CBS 650.93]KIX02905.1 ATP-dependent Clp endopeptidase, proteolytic subunit ClpP [Rhinocladiella mackenziei CBS 650.93]